MLTVVLVDLVDTLVVGHAPAPGAAAALAALAELDTADGAPLRVTVVGDEPDAVSVLGAAGLLRYLDSAPQAAPFAPALAGRAPTEGLSITADSVRAAEARALGLDAVVLGVDVLGWAAVPGLVAHLVDPDDTEAATFARSLRAHGQLTEPGADATAATHSLDEEGRIRRDRFRAI